MRGTGVVLALGILLALFGPATAAHACFGYGPWLDDEPISVGSITKTFPQNYSNLHYAGGNGGEGAEETAGFNVPLGTATDMDKRGWYDYEPGQNPEDGTLLWWVEAEQPLHVTWTCTGRGWMGYPGSMNSIYHPGTEVEHNIKIRCSVDDTPYTGYFDDPPVDLETIMSSGRTRTNHRKRPRMRS